MKSMKKAAGLLQSIGSHDSPDSILAHITPAEAAMLKARGGSGRRDPNTGLLHFEDSDSSSYSSYSPSSYGGDSDSGSYSYSGDNGSSNYETQYSNMAPMVSDPSYGSKGYYSAAGNYDDNDSQGSASTRYYGLEKNGVGRTIGGDIANSFGWDPEGFGSKFTNFGLGALGMINPLVKLGVNAGQAYAGSQGIQSPADMDGKGGSPNGFQRLAGQYVPFSGFSSKLASNLPSGMTTPLSAVSRLQAPSSAVMPSYVQSRPSQQITDEELLRQRGLLNPAIA